MDKKGKTEHLDSVDMTMGERLLLITLDPETMTTTCVGSELGLQFLHHKLPNSRYKRDICTILKKFLSDHYKSEITMREKLLQDIKPASDAKNSDTNKKLKFNVGATENRKSQNLLGTSRNKGEKIYNTETYTIAKGKSSINKEVVSRTQFENVSRSGRKRKIPKWLQVEEDVEFTDVKLSPCKIEEQMYVTMPTPFTGCQQEGNVTEDENVSEDENEKLSEDENDVSLSNSEESVKQINDDVDLNKDSNEKEIHKFKCRQCDVEMDTYFERVNHESSEHDFIDIGDAHTSGGKIDFFKCPICKSNRKSEEAMRLHIKDHIEMDPKELTCHVCDAVFKTKNRLQRHVLIHGEAKFPCSICGKKFRMQKYVRRHKMEFHKILEAKDKDGEYIVENIPNDKFGSSDTENSESRTQGSEQSSEIQDTNDTVEKEAQTQIDENGEKNKEDKYHIKLEIKKEVFETAVERPNGSGNNLGSESKGNESNDFKSCDSSGGNQFKPKKVLKLKCKYCSQSFAKNFNLTRHIIRKHSNRNDDVTVNIVKEETDKKIYNCAQCDEVSYTEMERIQHELKVHDFITLVEAIEGKNEKCFKCPICRTSRKQESSMKMHIQEHFQMDISELTCTVCHLQFKTKNRLTNHMYIHNEAKFPCNLCGKKFRMMKYVRRHMSETHNQKLLVQTKTESMKGEEKNSDQVESLQKPKKPKNLTMAVCDICGKSFRSQSTMLNHRTVHFGEKPHACQKCGKKFRLRSSLKNHKMIHKDSKDFVCEQCGKSFKISQGLRMHRLRYHEKVDYKCEICDRKFLSFGGKKYHILREHRDKVDSLGLKLHPCKYCSRICAGHQELLRHESSHVDNRSEVCEICNGRWPTVSQLNVHKKTHFGLNKKFECKTCQFKTATSWKLKRHFRSAKHLDNCLSSGVDSKTLLENMNTIPKDNLDGTNSSLNEISMPTENSPESQISSEDTQDKVAVVSSEALGQGSGNPVEEVQVKYLQIPENLGEGCQILYSEDGRVVYSVVEDMSLEEGTYIYDPSVNQAVESILKLQSS